MLHVSLKGHMAELHPLGAAQRTKLSESESVTTGCPAGAAVLWRTGQCFLWKPDFLK